MMNNADAAEGVVHVRGGGRGFVVENRYIITAGHCLPKLPPCLSFSDTHERTYERLLGKLGEEPTIWAECLFVDLIGDIAVLGEPDGEMLYDEFYRYGAFVDELTPLLIADVAAESSVHAQLLSLASQWFSCKVQHNGRGLWISDAAAGIVSGMSGSPILDSDGRAIGVLATGSNAPGFHGPNPRLAANLPGWLLNETDIEPSM